MQILKLVKSLKKSIGSSWKSNIQEKCKNGYYLADALKAGDQEKADKLYAAAATAKGDLINFYERIKAGEDFVILVTGSWG